MLAQSLARKGNELTAKAREPQDTCKQGGHPETTDRRFTPDSVVSFQSLPVMCLPERARSFERCELAH